jgi:hypothetical protein
MVAQSLQTMAALLPPTRRQASEATNADVAADDGSVNADATAGNGSDQR